MIHPFPSASDITPIGRIIPEGGTKSTFGGNQGVVYLKGPLQEVAFSRGQVTVVVSVVNTNAGAAAAIASLIASRM